MRELKEIPMVVAPHNELSEFEHIVQFCETDAFLINSVSEFIGRGLRDGHACIVVATEPHREAFDARLKADGLDVEAARARGQYISIDATAALSRFMVGGMPDAMRFATTVGSIVAQAVKDWGQVTIFGEMVALLWMDGNHGGAIRLEELWNDLSKLYPFTLFCAYSMQDFEGEVYAEEFSEICRQHSRVIPSESFSALTSVDDRLRAITLLQQKANSLEIEIAEREAAEEQLRLSENRYRRLFEASKDGILMVDPVTQVITDANPAAVELLGREREELLAKELWQVGLFKDREANLQALRELQERQVIRGEAALPQCPGGQRRDVEFVSNLYPINAHKVIQCNIRDITERKLLEERKDEFISIASHELRTPVTSLKGFTQILQRRFQTQDDEESLRFLAIMDTQLNKLTRLINDLLDISRIQQGVLEYQEDLFDFDALVHDVVENVQAGTTSHRLLIEGSTEARVYGDRDRIGQVLMNLLTNAVGYSPKADLVIVRLSKDEENILVSVQDFGIGIAPVHHKQIFERFYQVNSPERPIYSGLGLGLYLCSAIVAYHRGRIWVESGEGCGSTFSFTLPVAAPLMAPVSPASA